MDTLSEPLAPVRGAASPALRVILTPPLSPLAMPTQRLDRWLGVSPRTSFRLACRESTLLARCFVFAVAAALTGYGVWCMLEVVGQNNATGLQYLLVGLFGIMFLWIALAAANALLGLLALASRFDWSRGQPPQRDLRGRTAVVMPIYNEDTERVFANLSRMANEIVALGEAWHFDLFVLSDSTKPQIARKEREAALALRQAMLGRLNVYYRRRQHNEGRKAGNIADFVRRWGGNYEHMLVLDADSYMTASSMIALAAAMEADPKAALIQTVPRLIGESTLFARLQQFATGTYGPVVAAGLALVQGREGNYWGHNAIIRVRAFAAACGLPQLSGRKPFGGEVLSHDFVEAALLRRAGWDVYMRPDIGGSYEETPPTLSDHAVRDRRWEQGNIQHAAVLPTRGLHWMSRYHLLTGILSYLMSPLWLCFLLVGILLAWQGSYYEPDYFPYAYSLFPTWPHFDAQRAWTLLFFSAAVLLAPKAFAVVHVLFDKRARAGAGGVFALLLSVVAETLLSALLAPVLMLLQTGFIVQILMARDSGWGPQRRDAGVVSLAAVSRAYCWETLWGFVLLGISAAISTTLLLWMQPVWVGLILTIPIVYMTSLPRAGRIADRLGLFQTEESRGLIQAQRRLVPKQPLRGSTKPAPSAS